MPLQKQNIPVSFVQGLDLKDDRKQVVPGNFLELQNAIFTTPGMLRKRNGYTALLPTIAGGTEITAGDGLATFKNELLEFDGARLYSYSQSDQIWINKGPLASMEVSASPIIRNTFEQTASDMAEHSSGLQAFVWQDSRGTARYSIIDSVTGQAMVQDIALEATSVYPKAFAVGAYLVILYVRTSDKHLRMVSIPVSNPLAPNAAINVATNMDPTAYTWDAAMYSERLFIAYNNADVGGAIELKSINKFLVQSASEVVSGENADGCISITADSVAVQIWVSYFDGTDVKYFVQGADLATSVVAPTVVETVADVVRIVSYANTGAGTFWYEISAAETYDTLVKTNTATNAAVVGTPEVFLRSVGLAAKPFVYLDTVYLTVTFDTAQQPTYFTVTEDGVVVAKEQALLGGGLLTSPLVAETVTPAAGIFKFALLQKDLLTTIGGTAYTQTGVTQAELDFVSVNTFYKAQIAANLQLSGGILSSYDGVNVVEAGFNMYPENVDGTPANTGGHLGNASVATQYQYSVTYEWTDNQGQLHRSFPSIPDADTTFTFTSGTVTGQVTLTIPTLRLSQKTGVAITVYRTEGNGTIFYQLTNLGVTNPLLNDPTTDSVQYVDQQSDASIIGNPILYTTGNVVGNDAPPAPLVFTQYVNRLMLVPSENPLQIWFSEEAVPGTPLQFSANFVLNIDSRGGAITALQQMDSYLIIFKKNLIFYIVGQGPTNTGAQNDYGNAQQITTDAGCINARSVVAIPDGILYQSSKGIYLLGRNLLVSYIGAPVEAFNEATITSAVLIPTTNQVRFSTDDNKTTLVYDYFVKQWSTFTNHNTVDAVVYQNALTYVNPNGLVYQETEDHFTDNGAFIPLKAKTSWLSLASLQGFQRCYRALFLGEYISPHTLKVGVAYDFNTTQVQQDYINAGTLFDVGTYGDDSPYGEGTPYGGEYPLYEFRIDFQRQKCTSIQFTFEDVQASNYGEGLSLSAFNLLVGAKAGSNKVVSTKIYS